eukprot:CAMPEP_0113593526 /NCGR_PEP_ID=MMETSP0015_2-20120614/38495_1 /TAXON_ID=2838 /ORGANISM="Odontella" /LENGTH=62 /DNA_ID=CAMNT_0000500271 /DNA_START=40 /DNA_END=225 /DNA_ORIENTATION=- /assembly_acc=CAM_ASM_000160
MILSTNGTADDGDCSNKDDEDDDEEEANDELIYGEDRIRTSAVVRVFLEALPPVVVGGGGGG